MKGYKSLFNKIESILLTICFLSIIFLIGLQFVISNNDLSTFITGQDSFGKELNGTVTEDSGVVILKLENPIYDRVEVLVNGEVFSTFKGVQELRLTVYNNDLIEINGTKYDDSVTVRVDGISKNIMLPELDTIATSRKTIELLGKVILK